jgi:ELWxxDGT repeat protein
MKKAVLALFASFIAPFALYAQTAQLVKDINTIRNSNPSSSSPSDFIRYGSRIVFVASTSTSGRELWTTDGTAAGTSQLADILPGQSSSLPSRFTIVNGTLIFNAFDSRGTELWMSDGTTAGTRLMADIASGSSSSNPGDRIVYHGKMLFSAFEPVNGRELWITDGTPGGTRLLRDLKAGTAGSEPQSFVQLGDTVYFATTDALWKTDGTEAGTVVVKSVARPRNLLVAGPRIFFVALTQQTGDEPWVSDGTEAGTFMLADIRPGQESSMPYVNQMATALGDRVFFSANDSVHGYEPWISDGTPAGTRMFRDIFPGQEDSNVGGYAVIGSIAFFTANTPATGYELWKTDGTDAGTQLVRDIRPGKDSSAPASFTIAGNRLFFSASDGKLVTMWVTDGTDAGTHEVKPTQPRPAVAGFPAFIDGLLYFAGNRPLEGVELWKSDGTDAGTSMVLNIAPDPAPSSEPENLVAAGDWLYFDAWEGLDGFPTDIGSRSLWRTDGTPEGTLKVLEPLTYGSRQSAGHSLFFSRDNKLWQSDGTPETTMPAAAFASRFPSTPGIVSVLGDTIIAGAGNQLYAAPLGSNAPATALGPGGYPYSEVAGRLFFITGDFAKLLRVTDGTPGGTFNVVSNLPDNVNFIGSMGGHGYFTSYATGTGPQKLWRTDGTHDGTVVVQTGLGGNFVATETKLFFILNNQLWVTNGTDAGTLALPATPYTGGFSIVMVAAGDRIVFLVNNTATGLEPWVSDGTVEGTHLLRDINPGTATSNPSGFISVDGSVYMSATDDTHGTELWVTDGTTEGTRLAADVEPGTAGSFPQRLARAGDRLYFVAITTATGKELWSLTLPPHLTVRDVRVTEGDSGTTTAHFTATLSAPLTRTVTVEYATADGTASAGSDYDATSGTLTFNPGETSKSIDVVVRGDATAEGEETFFVKLRNAGAPLTRSTAFAIIQDNDRAADLGLTLDYSLFEYYTVVVKAANQGPSTATNIKPLVTRTPYDGSSDDCCPTAVRDVEPGAAPVTVVAHRDFGYQQYLTATASARERDPNPSNNRVSWTNNSNVSMDALYLTPGAQANVWMQTPFNTPSVGVESSNPAVLSVPASVAIPSGQKVVSFVVRGLSAGSATIRIFTPANTWGTLKVDVVAPGSKPRWPGAIRPFSSDSTLRYDKPAIMTIYTIATAPDNGRTATGQVTITANGHVAGSGTLPATADPYGLKVPFYLADIGTNAITVDYAGDENFLPSQLSWNMVATRGVVTITDTATPAGANATLHIVVAGSPMASPSGTIKVSEAGVIAPIQATLVSNASGVARADIVLPNVASSTHTLLIEYSGDTKYEPATQNTRLISPRTRSARH